MSIQNFHILYTKRLFGFISDSSFFVCVCVKSNIKTCTSCWVQVSKEPRWQQEVRGSSSIYGRALDSMSGGIISNVQNIHSRHLLERNISPGYLSERGLVFKMEKHLFISWTIHFTVAFSKQNMNEWRQP